MHVFPKSPNNFRAIYTVGSANRFCYVNNTTPGNQQLQAGKVPKNSLINIV
jgi:hypothetical protein